MKDNRKKRKRFLPIWFLLIALLIGGCGSETESRQTDAIMQQTLTETADTLEETQEQRAVVASDETESAAETVIFYIFAINQHFALAGIVKSCCQTCKR